MKRASVFLSLLAFVSLFVCACNREDAPVIRSGGEYDQVLARAKELSEDILIRYEDGTQPSDEERQSLRQAAVLFESLAAFKPNNFANPFAAGKIYQILGDHEMALQKLKESIEANPGLKENELSKHGWSESHHLMSISLEHLRKYDEALEFVEIAVRYYPDSPDYLAQKASVLIQLKRIPEARQLIAKARRVDALHPRAKQLDLLLSSTPK